MALFFSLLLFFITCCLAIMIAIPSFYVLVTFGSIILFKKLRTTAPKPNTIVDWLRAIIYEWPLAVSIYSLRLLFDLTGYHPNTFNPGSNSVVLLVHGYQDAPLTWWFFKKKLQQRLRHCQIITVALQPKLNGISELALCLDKTIEEICSANAATKIHLVGHSMGGLVSTYYAKHLAAKRSVESLATLGSPFSGTYLSKMAEGENAKEMRYQSAFTDALRQDFAELNCRKLQIASSADNIIVPWQSALCTEEESTIKTSQVVINHLGHMSLLYSEAVVAEVASHCTASGS